MQTRVLAETMAVVQAATLLPEEALAEVLQEVVLLKIWLGMLTQK